MSQLVAPVRDPDGNCAPVESVRAQTADRVARSFEGRDGAAISFRHSSGREAVPGVVAMRREIDGYRAGRSVHRGQAWRIRHDERYEHYRKCNTIARSPHYVHTVRGNCKSRWHVMLS